MRLLLDEMYPRALAEVLRASGLDAHTVVEAGLAGRPDADVLAAAVAVGDVLLTENLADVARLAADHLTTGGHHPGVLVALPSRLSRRRAGIGVLVSAVRSVIDDHVQDRPPPAIA